MGRRKQKESRKAPLVCYTTETYKKTVTGFVEKHHPGLTLSTWMHNLVLKEVPQDMELSHA